MEKVLITGSTGYLGSSFIDNYSDKYEFKKFSLLTQKLEDIDFKDVDAVLHCAALVHQKQEDSYEKYHEINVEYPVELAKLAKENGVKQFVFISTIAVYGEEKEKLDENTICNPITPYGKSKLEAEKELLKLNDDSFIVSIIRPPMVYGKDAPGNIDSLVKLVKKVLVLPFGGIDNRRSFVYVGNLCWLVDCVIERLPRFARNDEEVVSRNDEEVVSRNDEEVVSRNDENVFLACDDEPLSTTRLIELIAKSLGKKVYLVKVPFFERFLRLVKPSFHKRLYGSLEVDNSLTMQRVFEIPNQVGNDGHKMPYSVEEGIRLMLYGEC